MTNRESLGFIYWNTSYPDDDGAKLEHLAGLVENVKAAGAADVSIFLSEVTGSRTRGSSLGLQEMLLETGYDVNYRPTSAFTGRVRFSEGVAFATPPGGRSVKGAEFINTIRTDVGRLEKTVMPNSKKTAYYQRRLGKMSLPGVVMFGTHGSILQPRKTEVDVILDEVRTTMETQNNNVILGGDINTYLWPFIEKPFLRRAREIGLVALPLPRGQRTTSKQGPVRGRLDHVLVNESCVNDYEIEAGDPGPSDHSPLLVVRKV